MTLASVSICPDTLQTQAGVRFLSVCSGIEAASVAWEPLGWRALAFSEIEPFPSAVLAHHYPSVPNLGDMTTLPEKIRDGVIDAPEILCGGTPCQAFSVAGLRRSLEDDRGNLSLTFCEIANAIDAVRAIRGALPSVVFWENVPGVLSTKDNAFGCFLAGLAGEDLPLEPPGGKWTDAGCVHGPARTVAWRTLDAQYFGLAQRRRRVFVVSSARDQFDPAAVLFEWEGVRRDSAPGRETGQRIAPTIAGCANGGGANGPGRDVDSAESLQVMSSGQANAEIRTDGGAPTPTCLHEAPIVAHSLRGEGFDASEDGTGRGTPTLTCLHEAPIAVFQQSSMKGRGTIGYDDSGVAKPVKTQMDGQMVVTHSLRGEGFDVSEDGTGRGTPLVPVHAFDARQSNVMQYGDKIGPLDTNGHSVAVAFSVCPDHCGGDKSGQDVAFLKTIDVSRTLDCTGADVTRKQGGVGVAHTMQVRRLTPVECERLQGFPDGYTAIPYRNKSAHQCPDGPRYKALGNSWAVPVVRWIGERIHRELRGELRPET